MEVDSKYKTIDVNGRPVGNEVELYGRKPSRERYRCQKCKSTNIDQFHVEGRGKAKDSKGYTINGTHDQEGWPCGGRCWPWIPPESIGENKFDAEEVATAISIGGDTMVRAFGRGLSFIKKKLGK